MQKIIKKYNEVSSIFTSIEILLQYDVIMMLFYEVIMKSQILSNKFIKKKSEKVCHIICPQKFCTLFQLNLLT